MSFLNDEQDFDSDNQPLTRSVGAAAAGPTHATTHTQSTLLLLSDPLVEAVTHTAKNKRRQHPSRCSIFSTILTR